jgi:DMSO/TMAO reductase YedYZ heme-binding membrane subunit
VVLTTGNRQRGAAILTNEQRIRWIAKPLMFVLCLTPLTWLGWQAFAGGLGANPIEAVNRFLGDWALRFLLISLAVTPLREVLRLPVLIRFRRILGLFAFFYVTLHLSSDVGLTRSSPGAKSGPISSSATTSPSA